MFRKISLTALALASAVALAPNANASTTTATVSFSGTVASSCSFATPTAGTLGSPSSSNTMGIGSTGYAAGSISLTCNTSSSLSVSDPTAGTSNGLGASTPATTGTYASVTLPSSAGVCYSSQATSASSSNCSSLASGTTALGVDMVLSFASAPTAAAYVYQTTITATYN